MLNFRTLYVDRVFFNRFWAPEVVIVVTKVGQHLFLKIGFNCLCFEQMFLGGVSAKIIEPFLTAKERKHSENGRMYLQLQCLNASDQSS